MRDYYRILGLKETASGEEIHARWIELMRKFHPDRRRGGAKDERIKEINEAYEVLKHPSARAHYDLQRTYYRKKRNFHLQRLILPPAVVILFLILALIYFQKPKISPPPESTVASARVSITNVPTAPNQTNQTDQIDQTNEINQTDDLNASNVLNVPNDPNDLNDTNDINDPYHLITKADASVTSHKAVPQDVSRKQVNPNIPNVPNDTNDPTVFNQTNQIDQTNEINQLSVAHASTTPTVPNDINDLNDPNDINDLNQTNQINLFSQLTPPPLLASEEEVKHFFALYRGRYNRKDIDAFLSLFSPGAVQNQRDGFDEIKKIYSDFFDQSQKLRYHIKDMRIEIFQNAVEVRARYEIDQILKKRGKKKVWKGEIRWILVKENRALKIRFLDYKPQESP